MDLRSRITSVATVHKFGAPNKYGESRLHCIAMPDRLESGTAAGTQGGNIVSIDIGSTNYAYCVFNTGQSRVVAWDTCTARTAPELYRNLQRLVTSVADPVARALVERQLPRNGQCVRVQAWTEMFFAARGVQCEAVDPRLKYGRERMAGLSYRARKAVSVNLAAEVADGLGCAQVG